MESLTGSKVRSYIVENFLFGDESRLPPDDQSLIEGGVIDSTGVLELIEFLEDAFGISVEEAETVPQNLGSVSALERYIAGKLNPAAVPSA